MILLPSVAIYYFDIVGVTFLPPKTNAVLIVYSDTVLAFPISRQRFKTVAGQSSQRSQCRRGIDPIKFDSCLALNA